MIREVIVCSNCKGEDCKVIQLMETEKVDMKEYARRHQFPKTVMNAFYEQTCRRFQIICQDCGHTHEFLERVEPPQPVRFSLEYSSEVQDI